MKKSDLFIASFLFTNANGHQWELIIYINPDIEWTVKIDGNDTVCFNLN